MVAGPSQHYTYCHRALPSIFFKDPVWLFSVINGADGQRFLSDVWARAGELSAPDSRREPVGLQGEAFREGNHLCALVHLPAPEEAAECHFVMMIAGFATPEEPSVDRLGWARCFTLERGVDFRSGEACTFLCEWTLAGQHRNLGGGPAAEAGAFVEAVLAAVADGGAPVASSSRS